MARPDCVSCGSTTRRGKLLRCLHALCVDCLEKRTGDSGEVVCPDCEKVTPASTTGVSQLQSLPDSDVSTAGAGGGQQQQLRKFCDECAEDTVAVATCSDCNDNFCADHAKVHPTSRRSYKHNIVSLSHQAAAASLFTSSNKPTAANCPLHLSSKLSHYCVPCNKLLCDKCLATKHHENHRCQVHPIQQAAAEVRKSLTPKMAASFTGQESVLEVALNKAETALSGLQEETESVSAQITGFFDAVKKAIDKRQQELLDQLDTLRSAHLLPLEQQKQRLLSGLSSGQQAKHLTETCCDDVNFLKMAVWLEDATSDAISAADTEVRVFNPGTLVFTPCFAAEMNTAIDKAGVVDNVDVSSSKSTMTCPSTVEAGEDLLVTIKARNTAGDILSSVKQAHLEALKVAVVADDNTSTACPVTTTSPTATAGAVLAKYKTTKTGPVTVSATTRSGHHLRGSPSTVNIIDCQLRFDPARCHADIRLSNGNQTATHVGTGCNWRAVCCNPKWTAGKHEIAIRIDHVSPGYNCHHLLFICNADQPRLDAYQSDTGTVFGWFSYDTRSGTWKGSDLGQPWQSGDVIRMSLDCDTHTLVGRHDRTGTTQTLTNVTGQQLYPYIAMLRPEDQVTIL